MVSSACKIGLKNSGGFLLRDTKIENQVMLLVGHVTKSQREVYRLYIILNLLISFLMQLILLSSLGLSGTKFHILGPRVDMLSEPW